MHIKDTAGAAQVFDVMIDEGTGYVVAALTSGHFAVAFSKMVLNHWIAWAGPQDAIYADAERGFALCEAAAAIGRAGTRYMPSASYFPWQKGLAPLCDGRSDEAPCSCDCKE